MTKVHKVLKVHQTGKTDKLWDMRYAAKYPGKRTTRRGSVYYEYRKNRSDISRKAPHL